MPATVVLMYHTCPVTLQVVARLAFAKIKALHAEVVAARGATEAKAAAVADLQATIAGLEEAAAAREAAVAEAEARVAQVRACWARDVGGWSVGQLLAAGCVLSPTPLCT